MGPSVGVRTHGLDVDDGYNLRSAITVGSIVRRRKNRKDLPELSKGVMRNLFNVPKMEMWVCYYKVHS
jgi:hypothetical protein